MTQRKSSKFPFFYVLIGLELFENVILYFKENIFHSEIIPIIGLIAILIKAIFPDFSEIDSLMATAIALLTGSIATGYHLLKKSNKEHELLKRNFDNLELIK